MGIKLIFFTQILGKKIRYFTIQFGEIIVMRDSHSFF
jgi:hypothetical protein